MRHSLTAPSAFVAIKAAAVTVRGTVQSIADNYVVIRTASGGKARIPVSKLRTKGRRDLKLGALVVATLSLDELKQWNRATSSGARPSEHLPGEGEMCRAKSQPAR